jgi:multiple sugar transport system substrate-binding protein
MLKLKTIVKSSLTACVAASLLAVTACQTASPAGAGGATGAPASGPQTVSLSVMTSDRFLEMAKQKFEEQHPDIKIDIKESVAAPVQPQGKGMMMSSKDKPDPKNAEKYVDDVNTALMSGKASDIIVMSNLPYKKYADKKLLENVSVLMSQDSSFHMDDYYANIFDAMKVNGNLYEVPVKVALNMWLGNEAVLSSAGIDGSKWTWEDFVSVSRKLTTDKNSDGSPDVYPLGYIEPADLMTYMLNSSFAKFVDTGAKKAKFDSPEFIGLLKLAKSMYDDKLIAPQGSDLSVTMFQNKAKVNMYMDMVTMPQFFYDGKGAYYNVPSENGSVGTSFTSDMQLAINSKSAHKQAAWQFVKFLLSNDMQSAAELMGFAVNKQAAKANEDELRQLGQSSGVGGGKAIKFMINGKEMTPKPATDQDIERIEQALAGIKTYAESDPKIAQIVADETAPFFQGQKSAEETAKVIQNKAGTYLQE